MSDNVSSKDHLRKKEQVCLQIVHLESTFEIFKTLGRTCVLNLKNVTDLSVDISYYTRCSGKSNNIQHFNLLFFSKISKD